MFVKVALFGEGVGEFWFTRVLWPPGLDRPSDPQLFSHDQNFFIDLCL